MDTYSVETVKACSCWSFNGSSMFGLYQVNTCWSQQVHHLGSPLPGLLITTGFYPSQPSAVGPWDVASTASVLDFTRLMLVDHNKHDQWASILVKTNTSSQVSGCLLTLFEHNKLLWRLEPQCPPPLLTSSHGKAFLLLSSHGCPFRWIYMLDLIQLTQSLWFPLCHHIVPPQLHKDSTIKFILSPLPPVPVITKSCRLPPTSILVLTLILRTTRWVSYF